MTEATVKDIAATAALNVISRPDVILDLQKKALKLKIQISQDKELLSGVEINLAHSVAFDATFKNDTQRKAALEKLKLDAPETFALHDSIGNAESELSQLELQIQHLKMLQTADLALVAYVTALHS